MTDEGIEQGRYTPEGNPGRRVSDRFGDSANHWHVGREIPVAIILTLLLQTIGGVWWFAQLSFKIDAAIAQLAEFKVERYTKEDARRDRELVIQIIEQLRARDTDIDRRMGALEAAIGSTRGRPAGMQ